MGLAGELARQAQTQPVLPPPLNQNKIGDIKKLILPGGEEMLFRWCPPGQFLRGQYLVTLTNGFWLGITPVTRGQWDSVMQGYLYNPDCYSNSYPVECISWRDAQRFIACVNITLRCDMRLPTEAEWEYACRSGTNGKYARTGLLDEQGWYATNSEGSIHYVKKKMPNQWGFFDMHGNVWEWCSDWYGDYPDHDVVDPEGAHDGNLRVCRGGCYRSDADCCSPAYRECGDPYVTRWAPTGFRVALSGDVGMAHRAEDENTANMRVSEVRFATHGTSKLKTGGMRKIKLSGGVEMAFRWCPPGAFIMGSPPWEEGRASDEVQHRVTFSKGFWLGMTVVTQRQWASVMGYYPSSDFKDNLPVYNASWDECQVFIEKVNGMLKCGMRLPTEAEWEYACRAGTTGAYAGGWLDRYGWHDGRINPVKSKEANPWGFFDMHGNVREWCSDWYGDYPDHDVVDPSGPSLGNHRVCRGGASCCDARACRSASRHRAFPVEHSSTGFRIVIPSV